MLREKKHDDIIDAYHVSSSPPAGVVDLRTLQWRMSSVGMVRALAELDDHLHSHAHVHIRALHCTGSVDLSGIAMEEIMETHAKCVHACAHHMHACIVLLSGSDVRSRKKRWRLGSDRTMLQSCCVYVLRPIQLHYSFFFNLCRVTELNLLLVGATPSLRQTFMASDLPVTKNILFIYMRS